VIASASPWVSSARRSPSSSSLPSSPRSGRAGHRDHLLQPAVALFWGDHPERALRIGPFWIRADPGRVLPGHQAATGAAASVPEAREPVAARRARRADPVWQGARSLPMMPAAMSRRLVLSCLLACAWDSRHSPWCTSSRRSLWLADDWRVFYAAAQVVAHGATRTARDHACAEQMASTTPQSSPRSTISRPAISDCSSGLQLAAVLVELRRLHRARSGGGGSSLRLWISELGWPGGSVVLGASAHGRSSSACSPAVRPLPPGGDICALVLMRVTALARRSLHGGGAAQAHISGRCRFCWAWPGSTMRGASSSSHSPLRYPRRRHGGGLHLGCPCRIVLRHLLSFEAP